MHPLTTLLTFPIGFTRLPTTSTFQAEQVLLINRSTERPAGPLPSLHLLSSAPIDIHVASVVENYHSFQSHLFYILLRSSLTFRASHTDDVFLSFTCFYFLCHPPIQFLSLLLLHSGSQGAGVYPRCLGAKLRSESSHVASLL